LRFCAPIFKSPVSFFADYGFIPVKTMLAASNAN
jgi:hypothetical protein